MTFGLRWLAHLICALTFKEDGTGGHRPTYHDGWWECRLCGLRRRMTPRAPR